MNGFEEMATQFELETLVNILDTKFNQKIDEDRALAVIEKLEDALVLMKTDEDTHPVEEGVAALIYAAFAIYTLINMGSPTAVALMARDLLPAAMEFNEGIQPLLTRLYEKVSGEKHE